MGTATWVRVGALCIVFASMVGGRVAAAPQILGLLATAKPLPLRCADGVCGAEFSAFCLQEFRTSPPAGTAYRAARGTELTLSYTDPKGARRTLAASHRVIITARRDYHAVRIALPESALRLLGARDAAIAVGALASVVPIARPGDAVPLDRHEIAYETGPHRASVARAFIAEPEPLVLARTLNRLINALPPGRATAQQRGTVWRQAIGDAPGAHAGAGLLGAAREFQVCKQWADTGLGAGLRDCLEEGHDITSFELTETAWEISQPGS